MQFKLFPIPADAPGGVYIFWSSASNRTTRINLREYPQEYPAYDGYTHWLGPVTVEHEMVSLADALNLKQFVGKRFKGRMSGMYGTILSINGGGFRLKYDNGTESIHKLNDIDLVDIEK